MKPNFDFRINLEKMLRHERQKFFNLYPDDNFKSLESYQNYTINIAAKGFLDLNYNSGTHIIGQMFEPTELDSDYKPNQFFQVNVNGESGQHADQILGQLLLEIQNDKPEYVFVSAIDIQTCQDFVSSMQAAGYCCYFNYLEFDVTKLKDYLLGNLLAVKGNRVLELKYVTGSGVVPHWLYDHLTIQERVEQLGYPAWSILVAIDHNQKRILSNTYFSPFDLGENRIQHLQAVLKVCSEYPDYQIILSGDFNTFGTMAHPYWQYETLGKRGFLIGNLASYLAGYNNAEEDEIKNLLAETDSKLKLLSPPQTTFVGISKLERAVAKFMKLNIDKTITNSNLEYKIEQIDIGSDHTLQKYT